MTRTKIGLIGVLIISVLSFMAGYWPQHTKYLDTASDLKLADKQLREAMNRQRIYRLENVLLQALNHTAHDEFKEAQDQTTQFFIEVRTDMSRPDMRQYAADLKDILAKSAEIDHALALKDQRAREMLRGVMQQLARLVGPEPTLSEPPPTIRVTSPPQS